MAENLSVHTHITCVIDANEWKRLESEYCNLKGKYGLSEEKEVKWSFARSLHMHQNTGKEVCEKKMYLS